ncbi:fucolectin-4-like [Patiria miniata]|uniref:Uncharacterized protein n=1 Tax=Patiria miniata TaxID=46514 RepID=A0A913ZB37_PATMI|nr:fucolectin-4-like [Patiria miniata]
MASVLRWDLIGVLLLLMEACLLSGAYFTAEQKTDPWWRLDLEDVYCLRNVTIYNRQNNGAEVRAGLNPDRLSNRMIGKVTLQQTTDKTRPIEISVDPVVNARYVSVDLPGTNKILAMCEVEVGEYEDK